MPIEKIIKIKSRSLLIRVAVVRSVTSLVFSCSPFAPFFLSLLSSIKSRLSVYFLAAGLALVGIALMVFPVETLGIPPAFFLPPALRSAAKPASAKPFMMVSFPVAPALVAMTVSMFLLIWAESFC